jgi:O-antigen/teichoic acid export membrane protein
VSSIKQLAGQTAVYGLSSIIGRLLNYLLVPFYTRIFSAGEYGVVSELFAWVGLLTVLYTYGMETSFFHFANKIKDPGKVYNTGVTSLFVSSLLLSGFAFLFSGSIADALQYSKHPEYIRWFSLIIFFDTLATLPFARLRRENKALRFAAVRLANIFINIFFNIFFLVLCPVWIKDKGLLHNLASLVYSPAIGVGYVFISNLIASMITLLILIPQFKDYRFQADKKLLKEMLLYGFPLLIGGMAGMVNETFDRAVYKFLAPDSSRAMHELGIYAACYKLSIIMTLFIQTFRYAAEPFFFSHYSKDGNKEVYARIMNYFIIACSFIFVVVMLFMDIFKLFIGENFRSGLHVVPVLLMANLFLGVFFNLSVWYKLTGQTRYGAYFSIAGAIITIVLLFIMVPRMGYTGAAWATLICYASMMLMSYFAGQKNYPIPYDLRKMFFYPVMALLIYFAMEGAVLLIKPEMFLKFLIAGLLTGMFLLMVWMMEKNKTNPSLR